MCVLSRISNQHNTQGEGDLLLFSGQNQHRGVEIAGGKRYILTGFVSLREQSFCPKEMSRALSELNADDSAMRKKEEQEARKRIEEDMQRERERKERKERKDGEEARTEL